MSGSALGTEFSCPVCGRVYVSAIRSKQPSREQIREYFEHPVDRFLGPERTLEEWIEFGMEAQRRHSQPFVWICNTNRGVAKVSRAALGRIGIEVDVLEREGYLGDPSVKGSLRILPRVGVWLRLTRNLDKQRGFVNGAIGEVVEVFRFPDIFSVRLTSGTLVMVHPVSFAGETFLPCVYGYAVTVRRTQGLTLFHGALYLDGRIFPRPRGHGYVAVSRFRSSLGVYHYGPLRRSDWLPTEECVGEQVEPSELSPADWLSDESSEEEFGGFGANYRSGVRDIATGVSDCESESSDCGLGGRGRCSDDEDPYAEIRTGLADSSSEDGSEADDVRRCASPEALPLAVDVWSDDEAHAAVPLVAEVPVKEELVEYSGEPPSSSMAPAVPVQDPAAPAAPLPRRLQLGEGVSMETELPDSKRVRVS